jgi:hypothetical protein
MQLNFCCAETELDYLSDETQLPRSKIEDGTWIECRLLFWLGNGFAHAPQWRNEHVLLAVRENIPLLLLK